MGDSTTVGGASTHPFKQDPASVSLCLVDTPVVVADCRWNMDELCSVYSGSDEEPVVFKQGKSIGFGKLTPNLNLSCVHTGHYLLQFVRRLTATDKKNFKNLLGIYSKTLSSNVIRSKAVRLFLFIFHNFSQKNS